MLDYPGNIELLIASMSRVAGIMGVCHHAWSDFNFFANFFPSVISFNKCNVAANVLSAPFPCYDKYPDKSNLREKGLNLVHILGPSHQSRQGSKMLGPEATGHSAFSVRQRARDEGKHLVFGSWSPFHSVQAQWVKWCCPHWVGFPTKISPIKIPHRCACRPT